MCVCVCVCVCVCLSVCLCVCSVSWVSDPFNLISPDNEALNVIFWGPPCKDTQNFRKSFGFMSLNSNLEILGRYII
jgi:hypothetical protein